MNEGSNSIKYHFNITREEVAKEMSDSDIPDDIKTFLNKIREMCES
jgi:hypothetical protein